MIFFRLIYQKNRPHTIHWDWYIYLHLVDVYGKCRQIYYRPIAFVMASKLSQKIRPILPSDARQFNGKFGSKDRQDPSDGTRRNKPHVWRVFFFWGGRVCGGAEIETTNPCLCQNFCRHTPFRSQQLVYILMSSTFNFRCFGSGEVVNFAEDVHPALLRFKAKVFTLHRKLAWQFEHKKNRIPAGEELAKIPTNTVGFIWFHANIHIFLHFFSEYKNGSNKVEIRTVFFLRMTSGTYFVLSVWCVSSCHGPW